MAATAIKATLTDISKADLRHFVVHSVLLKLIDPVRGAPTRTSLDEDPDGDFSSGQKLRQKFLDSFALICSTSGSGAKTASAVCLEQHPPAGTILRVARNHGLMPDDLRGLENVLQILRAVARRETLSAQAELEILRLVAELDKGRISSILGKIEKRGLLEFLRETHSGLLTGQVIREIRTDPSFRLWLESYPFEGSYLQAYSPMAMASLIDWASQARWLYSKQLQKVLRIGHTQEPPWLDGLYKLARYRSAIKSMVKLAVKQPEVFADIRIQAVRAPTVRPFSLPAAKDQLRATVSSLVEEDSDTVMDQLEKHLGTQNAEEKLREACRLKLTLHAEMQLIVFYEENPGLVPLIPFIGTSKKACFLCHEYLLRHPLRLQVSACHQKIYPTWMPPPYYSIPGQFKQSNTFTKLNSMVKQLAKRDLKTALTAPRRPRNQDSTAGPSLTVTATMPRELEA